MGKCTKKQKLNSGNCTKKQVYTYTIVLVNKSGHEKDDIKTGIWYNGDGCVRTNRGGDESNGKNLR